MPECSKCHCEYELKRKGETKTHCSRCYKTIQRLKLKNEKLKQFNKTNRVECERCHYRENSITLSIHFVKKYNREVILCSNCFLTLQHYKEIIPKKDIKEYMKQHQDDIPFDIN